MHSKGIGLMFVLLTLSGAALAIQPASDADLEVVGMQVFSNSKCMKGSVKCSASEPAGYIAAAMCDVLYGEGSQGQRQCTGNSAACFGGTTEPIPTHDVCPSGYQGKTCNLRHNGWCARRYVGTCGTVYVPTHGTVCGCVTNTTITVGQRSWCM